MLKTIRPGGHFINVAMPDEEFPAVGKGSSYCPLAETTILTNVFFSELVMRGVSFGGSLLYVYLSPASD
jgi:hypothetical protein